MKNTKISFEKIINLVEMKRYNKHYFIEYLDEMKKPLKYRVVKTDIGIKNRFEKY